MILPRILQRSRFQSLSNVLSWKAKGQTETPEVLHLRIQWKTNQMVQTRATPNHHPSTAVLHTYEVLKFNQSIIKVHQLHLCPFCPWGVVPEDLWSFSDVQSSSYVMESRAFSVRTEILISFLHFSSRCKITAESELTVEPVHQGDGGRQSSILERNTLSKMILSGAWSQGLEKQRLGLCLHLER